MNRKKAGGGEDLCLGLGAEMVLGSLSLLAIEEGWILC